jgi:hypothetical protein
MAGQESGAGMRVRIGITDTSKVVELEIDDIETFQGVMERAMAEGGLAWFTDTRQRVVGVPTASVAFVEIEATEVGPAVGFAPAV